MYPTIMSEMIGGIFGSLNLSSTFMIIETKSSGCVSRDDVNSVMYESTMTKCVKNIPGDYSPFNRTRCLDPAGGAVLRALSMA